MRRWQCATPTHVRSDMQGACMESWGSGPGVWAHAYLCSCWPQPAYSQGPQDLLRSRAPAAINSGLNEPFISCAARGPG